MQNQGFVIGDHVETIDKCCCMLSTLGYKSGIVTKIKNRKNMNRLIYFCCKQTNKIERSDESWLQEFRGDNMTNQIGKFLKAVEKEFGVTTTRNPNHMGQFGVTCVWLQTNCYECGSFIISGNNKSSISNFDGMLNKPENAKKVKELWAKFTTSFDQSDFQKNLEMLRCRLEDKFDIDISLGYCDDEYEYTASHNNHQCGSFTIYDVHNYSLDRNYDLNGMFSYSENREIFKKLWNSIFKKYDSHKKPEHLNNNN